jgi:hypothetical protein
MSTLKVTHLQNESNSAPSISISSAVGGGVTFAGISTFHSSVNIGGNLGIGIDNPESTSQLHIKNTSGNAKITLETNETYDSYINFSGASAEASIGYEPTSNSVIISNSADGLTSNERLRLDSSGRLLLGTNSSYGSANSDDLTIGDRTQSEIGITLGATVASAIRFADAGNVSAGMIQYVHNSGGTDYLNFYTNGANERLRINSAGKICCGTNINTSSTYELSLTGADGTGGFYAHGRNHYLSNRSNTHASLTLKKANTDSDGLDYLQLRDSSNALKGQITGAGNWKPISGGGIDFSAQGNSGGMTNELLDDYEEGTFTATITPGSGSYSYSYGQTGYYRKIGTLVFINVWIHLSTSNASGTVTLSGLPFNCHSTSRNWIPVGGYGHGGSPGNSAGMWLIITNGATTGSFLYLGDSHGSPVTTNASHLVNSSELYINGSYISQ